MDQSDYNTEPAEPGKPLQPDELEPSPPQFAPQQAPRKTPASGQKGHPTAELAIGHAPGRRSAGAPSSGTHPTSALNIRRR